MTFKKPTRAGLLALALGAIFAFLLSMSVIDRTYAEEAAAAPAAAAAPPPAPAMPIPSSPCSRNARRTPATPPGCSPRWRWCC